MRNTLGGDGNGFPRVSRRPGEEGLHTVPRWEDLVADPSKAGVLDAHTARIVAAKALGVFAASLYRLFEAADETMISASQAGRRLGETGLRAARELCPDWRTLRALRRSLRSLARSEGGSFAMRQSFRS